MTLSEVIVVAAIFAILVTLAALSLSPRLQIARARDSRREADLKKISIALEDYAGDKPCYPPQIYENVPGCVASGEIDPYLRQVPCDPQTKEHYPYVLLSCKEFVIYSTLELEKEKEYEFGNYALSSPNVRVIPTILPTVSPGGGTSFPIPTEEPAGPTPTPGEANLYGCFSGVCTPLLGFVCQPTYSLGENCGGFCGTPESPLNQCQ